MGKVSSFLHTVLAGRYDQHLRYEKQKQKQMLISEAVRRREMLFQAGKILLLLLNSCLPLIWAHHCNNATLCAGRCVLLIYGIVPSSRCALLLGGVLDASQSLHLGGDWFVVLYHQDCLALVTGLARGCLRLALTAIVYPATLEKAV